MTNFQVYKQVVDLVYIHPFLFEQRQMLTIVKLVEIRQ